MMTSSNFARPFSALRLMFIVGPIGFGSIWVLGTAGIMGGTAAGVALIEIAGAVVGGTVLGILGPSESYINIVVGAGVRSTAPSQTHRLT